MSDYKRMVFFSFLIGIFSAFCNSIRSFSGFIGIIFFVITVIFMEKISKIYKVALLFFLIIGFLSVNLLFRLSLEKRDLFLSKRLVSYVKSEPKHLLWHSIYIGFGFLNNRYGIVYDDKIAINKAKDTKFNVALYSKEYENILKREVIKLILNDPYFVIKTIFAKLGVILLYFITSANIGIYFIVKTKMLFYQHLAFILTIIFSSLFGFLVMPYSSYLLGFIATTILYSYVSLCNYFYIAKGN